MARRRRQQEVGIIPLIALLVIGLGVAAYKSQYSLILPIAGLLTIIVLIGLVILLADRARNEKLRRSGIAEIDLMSGLEFEKYLQLLLQRKGFTRVTLTATYDLGVDLVAHKGDDTWAIQAKRYKGAVGLDSVRQVVAAMNHYKCNKAMVITNSYFTNNAKVIAASTECTLIDRDALISLILE